MFHFLRMSDFRFQYNFPLLQGQQHRSEEFIQCHPSMGSATNLWSIISSFLYKYFLLSLKNVLKRTSLLRAWPFSMEGVEIKSVWCCVAMGLVSGFECYLDCTLIMAYYDRQCLEVTKCGRGFYVLRPGIVQGLEGWG